ncbi:hypothetical protein M9Y10_031754 [Tritrichomonas musculus]|uniref:Uncharacterized protein n=2 Tax=Tritrichomonas musculus TaxID=1915356 RepID=A0ABR2H1M9_9EUKA
MFALFLLILQIKGEASATFYDLISRAIANSKTKIPQSEREDIALPGIYHFNNVHFRLKQVLITPKTKDIKGYAVEDNYLAVVKRKIFDLPEEFVFVDSTTKYIYKMRELVFSDDNINIYQTRELGLFDLITDINYHAKTPKDEPILIDYNWDKDNNIPYVQDFPGETRFRCGIGAYGNLSVDTNITVKTYNEYSFLSNLDIDFKITARFELLYLKSTLKDSDVPLFQIDPIPLPELECKFTFKGLEFNIKPSVNINGSFDSIDALFPGAVEIQRGYHISGQKYTEFTPYTTIDSKWTLELYQLPQISTVESIDDSEEYSKFNANPTFNFFLALDIDFSQGKSRLETGLQVPFDFSFKGNFTMCMYPYLYGNIYIPIKQFYDFQPIVISFMSSNGKQNKTLIDHRSSITNVTIIETRQFCLDAERNIIERNPRFNEYYESNSYFVENREFSLETKKDGVHNYQIAVSISDSNNRNKYQYYIPFKDFSSTESTKINTHLIIETDYGNPNVDWFYNKFAEKTTDSMTYPGITSSYGSYFNFGTSSNTKQVEVSMTDLDDRDTRITGTAFIHQGKEILLNRFYEPRDSPYITTVLPASNYSFVCVYLQDGKKPVIDEKAVFYQEKASPGSTEERQIGKFNVNSDYYQLEFLYYYAVEPHTLVSNITVQTGDQVEILGSFSHTFHSAGNNTAEQLGLGNLRYTFYASNELGTSMHIHHLVKRKGNKDKTKDYEYTHSRLKTIDVNKPSIQPQADINELKGHIKLSRIQEHVAIQTSNNQKVKQLITTYEEITLKQSGRVEVRIETSDLFRMVRFKGSSICPLDNCYLFLKTSSVKLVLTNYTRLNEDIIYVYCPGNSIDILLRRSDEKTMIKIDYIVTEMNNNKDFHMNPNGELVKFEDTKRAKAFFAPAENGLSHLIYYSQDNLQFSKMSIDNYTEIVSVLNPDKRLRSVSFVSALLTLSDGQLYTSIESEIINKVLLRSNDRKFSIHVYAKNGSTIGKVRFNDKVVSANVNNIDPWVAQFDFTEIPKGRLDFYAMCKDNLFQMCEGKLEAQTGEYQVIKFTKEKGSSAGKDGLNITGKGMNRGVLKASKGTNITFFKRYRGLPEIERSYGKITSVTLEVVDNYPFDIPSAKTLGEGKATNTTTPKPTPRKTPVPLRTGTPTATDSDYVPDPTPTPIVHNMKDAFRTFCLKDDKGRYIPFSATYMNNNLDLFMKHLGIRSDYDESKYRINENDCISVDIYTLNSNDFYSVPAEAVDLGINGQFIKVNAEGADYVPYSQEEADAKEKKAKNKMKFLFIMVGVGVAVIVIILIVIAVLCLRKKKPRTRTVHNTSHDIEDNEDDDDVNEDDGYYKNLVS